MPVAIAWGLTGSAEGIMAGQFTPIGGGIILRGPHRFQKFGFTAAGAGAGWVGADASVTRTLYYYTGEVKNFDKSSFNNFSAELSLSIGAGWNVGVNLSIARDPLGEYIIGIGTAGGVGASPTFFTGQYSLPYTIVWGTGGN
jgi:hypothetical protein